MTTLNVIKKLSMVAAGAGIIALGTTGAANAAAISGTPAIDFSSPTTDFTNGAWSLGFKFSTNKTIKVESLGFYDDLKNDLTESHDVGIYDNSGNLLVSGTVNPGDLLDGWFRYTSVASTVLQAGKTYFIAATTGSENYTWNPNGFTVAPFINFLEDKYVVSNVLAFPVNGPSGFNGFFGPNFTAAPVPEPFTMLGVATAMGFGATFKRKLAKKQDQKDKNA